jgi:hypothetical protein
MPNKSSSTQAQDLPVPVANACRAITVFLTKLEKNAEKISQYHCSIGQHIAAIKARPSDWETIVKIECGLGRRRAYHFLAIVNGTETVEKQRAKNRERVARHRYRSALRNAQDVLPPEEQAWVDGLKAKDEPAGGPVASVEFGDWPLERLRLAEIKITGFESEAEDLKAQLRAERKLREKVGEMLREARGLTAHLPHTRTELIHKINQAAQALAETPAASNGDSSPSPEFLIRKPAEATS